MAGYSPNIADFDNDGWKDLFVSRGHVQSLARPAHYGRAAQHRVPKSWRHEIRRADGRGWVHFTTSGAPPRIAQSGTSTAMAVSTLS